MGNGNSHNELLAYRSYLENNIQYITEINKKIEKLILQLEKEHISINDCFVHLESYINILLNIYSRFTSLGGYDYCLKLKSLVQKYQQLENSEIQLSALYYIHSKILSLQEEHIATFPSLTPKKDLYRELSPTNKHEEIDVANFAYKWLTFKRNNICFIVLFDSYQIMDISQFNNFKALSQNFYFGTIDNSTITIRDPLRLDEQPSRSIVLVTYAGDIYGYFYDTIGKKLGAQKNIIARMLTRTQSTSSLQYGRVRLFGDSYIYLKHVDITKDQTL